MAERYARRALAALALSAVLAVTVFVTRAAAAEGFYLVTPEEYARAQTGSRLLSGVAPPEAAAPRPPAGAPQIVVERPERRTGLRSPLAIALRFEPAADAEVDLGSLAITYRVGFWWTDITARLREHAVIEGNRVTAEAARLPAGSHHIRVEVADTKGRKGARDIKFTVAEDVAAEAGGAYALAPITASPACSG